MQAVAHTQAHSGYSTHLAYTAWPRRGMGRIAGIVIATLLACVIATTPGYAAISETSDNDTSSSDITVSDTSDNDTSDNDITTLEASSSNETGAYQMRTPVRERGYVLIAPTVEVRSTIGPGTAYGNGATYTTAGSRNSTTPTAVTASRGRFVPRERR